MRRFFVRALVTIVLFGGAVASLTGCSPSASTAAPDTGQKSGPGLLGYDATAAQWQQGYINWVMKYGVGPPNVPNKEYQEAKKKFVDALEKRDKKAVEALLFDDFRWVEANGEEHNKAQILANLEPLAKSYGGQIDVRTTNFLDSVTRVLGQHHEMRFAHLWGKGPAGWQAVIFMDWAIPKERKADEDPPNPPTNPDADCENPCRTVPFKPADAAQAAVLKNWMEMKTAEWRPNPEVWSSRADPYHRSMSPGGDNPFLQHIASLAMARKLYNGKSGPGVPVLSMKMFTFGNVVIQEELEGRKGPEKPEVWKLRLFVNRGDGFKVAMSSQTRIQKNAGGSE
ncbi:MAG: nuclear transport factor 2 family protein [Acidobacteria bacterium]|nr:nuclear transport factor 2 family protein [Acidobacteriota bacterium]